MFKLILVNYQHKGVANNGTGAVIVGLPISRNEFLKRDQFV